MFLPYINYEVPISLCILGLDISVPGADNIDYVSLGQRSLAEFPFYAVYNRGA